VAEEATTDHDPMALLDGPPLPNPTPWESLAQQARWLAEYAERCAKAAPQDLLPAADSTDVLLEDLDGRLSAINHVVAACRSHTYRALADAGIGVDAIAAARGVSVQAIYKALRGWSWPA
jgi:hypothetical protein